MTEKHTPSKGDYIKVQGNKQYLPVPARVQWFRGEHPDWTISTSVVELQWTEGYAVMRAEVLDDTGRLIASGMKTETRKGFGDFVEKAETGAVGRALARAGYGTEDALDLEGDRYADAPIEQPERDSGRPSAGRRTASTPAATPAPAQYRRHELALLLKDHDLDNDYALSVAERLGITERPMSDESMDRLIEAIESERAASAHAPAPSTPDAGAPSPQPATAPAAPSPASSESALSMEDVLAVSGGEEIPPKPGTPEYKALPSGADRSKARAYWEAVAA